MRVWGFDGMRGERLPYRRRTEWRLPGRGHDSNGAGAHRERPGCRSERPAAISTVRAVVRNSGQCETTPNEMAFRAREPRVKPAVSRADLQRDEFDADGRTARTTFVLLGRQSGMAPAKCCWIRSLLEGDASHRKVRWPGGFRSEECCAARDRDR